MTSWRFLVWVLGAFQLDETGRELGAAAVSMMGVSARGTKCPGGMNAATWCDVTGFRGQSSGLGCLVGDFMPDSTRDPLTDAGAWARRDVEVSRVAGQRDSEGLISARNGQHSTLTTPSSPLGWSPTKK